MKKLDINTPNAKLVTVYTVNDPVIAELIRNTLHEHEIPCELDGEHQAGFTGTLEIGIIVRETDAEKALEFIKIHHPESH